MSKPAEHKKGSGKSSELIAAIISKDLEGPMKTIQIMQLIIEGQDVNAKDENGLNAFMHAAILGYVDLMKLMISKVDNLEEVNNEGETAFVLASKHKQTAAVQYLAAQGCVTSWVETPGLDFDLSPKTPIPNSDMKQHITKRYGGAPEAVRLNFEGVEETPVKEKDAAGGTKVTSFSPVVPKKEKEIGD